MGPRFKDLSTLGGGHCYSLLHFHIGDGQSGSSLIRFCFICKVNGNIILFIIIWFISIASMLLGAFAAITQELTLDATLKAVRSKFPGEQGEKNARVVEESYNSLVGGIV